MVDTVLRGLQHVFVHMYNILVTSPDTNNGLIMLSEECLFRQSQLDFLGHCLDPNSIHLLSVQVDVIQDFPCLLPPSNSESSLVSQSSTIVFLQVLPPSDILCMHSAHPSQVITNNLLSWTDDSHHLSITLHTTMAYHPQVMAWSSSSTTPSRLPSMLDFLGLNGWTTVVGIFYLFVLH